MKVKKSKITAIVLAVFLGIWTYTYTYSRDRRKFWILFWLTFTFIYVFISSAIQGMNAAGDQLWCNMGHWQQSNQELNIGSSDCDVYRPDYTWFYISFFAVLIIWGLAILDRSKTPKEYFSNYSVEK